MRYRKVYRIAGWEWSLNVRRDVQEYPVYERRWYGFYYSVVRGLAWRCSGGEWFPGHLRSEPYRFYTLTTPFGQFQWGWYWGWHTHGHI